MDEQGIPVATRLGYEVPGEIAGDGWAPLVRALGLATAALAGTYLISSISTSAYYLTVGRYGRNWFQLVAVVTWPLYLLPLAGGLYCARRPPRRWALVRWGLAVLLALRVLANVTVWSFLLLSLTPYASTVQNVASGATLAHVVTSGLTDLLAPAGLLWLATRPQVKRVFAPTS